MSAKRFARICGFAALVSGGRLIEAIYPTGVIVEVFWVIFWVILAASFDYWAYRKA